MFLCRINKNYLLSPNTPSYLELYLHVCQGLLTRTIMCESFLYAVELGTIKKNSKTENILIPIKHTENESTKTIVICSKFQPSNI